MEEFLESVERLRQSLDGKSASANPKLLEIDNDNVTVNGAGDYGSAASPDHQNDFVIENLVNELGDLYSIAVENLQSSASNEELQVILADLIGYDRLDLLISIIQKRTELVEYEQLRSRQEQIDENRRLAAERKANLKKSSGADQYPHVYTNSVDGASGGNMLTAFGTKYHLPEGTTRHHDSYYEEVVIPYPKVATRGKAAKAMQVPLIQISSLDTICQGTFSKYQTLNRMQTLVYNIAYETVENMLVCAPTGAGKTDVALLTMLNTIKNHMNLETQEVAYDEFKIIYIAPLKALAAEIVEKMGSRLGWLGIKVRELTGDMQLTRQEIDETQIIITTPEKWDVVTRKAQNNEDLISKVKLLVIDEVHLLHEERGAVIESLVARTLRQVERSQSLIRILGLSATLPNYVDVADFLRVNPQKGLFFFDSSFRPCPLKQEFVAVRGKAGSKQAADNVDNIAFEKLIDNLHNGHQVMIFVHSRKDTVKTARTFISMIQKNEKYRSLFDCSDESYYSTASREMTKFKNRDMKDLFMNGFGVHHAGLTRSERNMSEKLFSKGCIKVLCSTATLAWGVNLPAAVVIIKGTQLYDAQRGGYVDLGISDVIQIFGRAGRPQFEKFGTGILITTGDRLGHYLSLITQQHPIESRLQPKIADNLNAEIALGTVTTVDEGVQWLGYTYLFVRMRKNPLIYGLTWRDIEDDPRLGAKRRNLIVSSAHRLNDLQMIVYDTNTDTFVAKDTGRIASDYYLLNTTVEVFNQLMKPGATEADILAMVSMSGEFDGVKPRNEEVVELRKLLDNDDVQVQVAGVKSDGSIDSHEAKVNILLQSFISRASIQDSALNSDSMYVAQNASRICRSIFLLAVNRRWSRVARLVLILCQSIDKQMWWFDEHPLAQFDEINGPVLQNLSAKMVPVVEMKDMSSGELGDLVHNSRAGSVVARCVDRFPLLAIDKIVVQPITSKVLRVHLNLVRDFKWDQKYHGGPKAGHLFWVWVADTDDFEMLHVEKVIVSKQRESVSLDFTIPLPERKVTSGDGEEEVARPNQLVISAMSDYWLGAETSQTVSFEHLITPDTETVVTRLLRLRPLPRESLDNPVIENLYKFDYFNPMQTMVFHSIYHSQTSVLLGSPTGSGKTVACELAIWAAFRDFPGCKVVYIAPMKALVRERVDDWTKRFAGVVKVVELTGDTNPEASEIRSANIIITTPEKFDGLSRNWQTRKFVQQVKLVVMDEVHLLASDRGAILEMIVSRMRMSLKSCPRLLGMSTAVANATDLASWLGVEDNRGLFNFPPSVRPVPLQMYIDGFPDKPFGPLMSSMHKPAFLAIKRHSLGKPVLVFVPSRRQTRLTAQEFINLCASEENPRKFVRMDEHELSYVLSKVHDETLRSALQFGIGVHHAGLVDSDRRIAHELFASSKIQILIATSTLAWGVNLPAYLVIVKGTMFYDQKKEAYKDMDLTDVLQMMGRAGRPGFDDSGVACVLTKDSTKGFYKYFLNSGFPVESSLHLWFADHLGAEVANNAIRSKQDAMEFLTSTFLFRRVHKNPSYYQVYEEEDMDENGAVLDTQTAVNRWFTRLVDNTLTQLELSGCVLISADERIEPTKFLRISSFYYLSHKTMRFFLEHIPKWGSSENSTLEAPLRLLSLATEYDELAIRHNEDVHNEEFSMMKGIRYHGNTLGPRMVDPHVKTFLLLQSHLSRFGVQDLPLPDYFPDRIAVLDQSLRILQAAIDTAAELGKLSSVMNLIKLMIGIKQATWEPKKEDVSNPKVSPKLQITRDKSNHEKVTIVSKSPRIVPSKFHKPQQQSWFIIEHTPDKSSVISLRRYVPPRTLHLTVTNPTILICDSKLVQYELN